MMTRSLMEGLMLLLVITHCVTLSTAAASNAAHSRTQPHPHQVVYDNKGQRQRQRSSSSSLYSHKLRGLQRQDSEVALVLEEDETEEEQEEEEERYLLKSSEKCGDGKDKGPSSKSCAPSTSPSESPSSLPTISAAPSGTPSEAPSPAPSVSPAPSLSPSLSPSNLPSELPSKEPTLSPSRSIAPSYSPSDMPSIQPDIDTIIVDGTLFESSCAVDPPAEAVSTTDEETLTFRYQLVYSNTTLPIDSVVSSETILHFGMVTEFLSCDYSSKNNPNPFLVLGIQSAPSDKLLPEACDDVASDPEGTLCAVVEASLTWSVIYWKGRRRRRRQERRFLTKTSTPTSPEVLQVAQDFLQEFFQETTLPPQIQRVDFQGFVSESVDTANSNGGKDAITNGATASTNLSNNNNNTKSSFALGGAILGLSALVLLGILLVGNRRRNHRQKAYLKHLDELSLQDESDSMDSNCDDNDEEEERDERILANGKVELVLPETFSESEDQVWNGGDQDLSSSSSSSQPEVVAVAVAVATTKTDESDAFDDLDDLVRQVADQSISNRKGPTFVPIHPTYYSKASLRRLPIVRQARQNYHGEAETNPDTVQL